MDVLLLVIKRKQFIITHVYIRLSGRRNYYVWSVFRKEFWK